MKVSIHQPNFIPWQGFFDKIAKSNIFVLFDDVQLSVGRNFTTTAFIKSSNGKLLLTIPIKGKNVLIKDAIIFDNGWRDKHFKSIYLSYRKSPNFNKYIDRIENIYNKKWEKLVDFNTEFIKLINDILGIKTKMVFSSEISSELKGEEKILDIVKKLGGTEYLSGTGLGSKKYINEIDFEREGIKLVWQDFTCLNYPQLYGEFIPNLSIIDYIFNVCL